MTENYTNNLQESLTAFHALQWYIDNGVDELMANEPIDRTVMSDAPSILAQKAPAKSAAAFLKDVALQADIMGLAAYIIEAKNLAAQVDSIEALKEAIQKFDGFAIKKTASHVVFAAGNPQASIMVIDEAPGAEEDSSGEAFVGAGGQLQDKILASIGLSRETAYLTYALNWRPPGNRTPTQGELDMAQAFLERHIALIKPKMLIILGGTSAKLLLKTEKTLSKLRGSFHEYKMVLGTAEQGETLIPAIVTYRPDYLLNNPAQKKAVWADMQLFQAKMNEIDILN